MQKKTSYMPTDICKLCFKKITSNSFNNLLGYRYSLCDKCYEKLSPKFISFDIDGIKSLSIYEYDEDNKSLIYQYKGCYDYELKDIFLDRYKDFLFLFYRDYVIVPAPSSKEDDDERGFNHVIEIFKTLGLNMVLCIKKTKRFKQSDKNAKERHKVGDFLLLSESPGLKNKKVLLVDDIVTTGSTLRACIKLLRNAGVKEIKILTICKTKQHSD